MLTTRGSSETLSQGCPPYRALWSGVGRKGSPSTTADIRSVPTLEKSQLTLSGLARKRSWRVTYWLRNPGDCIRSSALASLLYWALVKN